jgi:hypothetical protein
MHAMPVFAPLASFSTLPKLPRSWASFKYSRSLKYAHPQKRSSNADEERIPQSEDDRPLTLITSVELSPGTSRRIEVREGDSPEVSSTTFAHKRAIYQRERKGLLLTPGAGMVWCARHSPDSGIQLLFGLGYNVYPPISGPLLTNILGRRRPVDFVKEFYPIRGETL